MNHSNPDESGVNHIPSFRDAASFRTTHTLEETLHQIVQDVVEALGYIGSMVATYEHGDTLPVQAVYVDPQYATMKQIQSWEREVSKLTRRPIKLTDPKVARTLRYDDAYRDNLSIQAAEAGQPVTSDNLYDLFVPIAPPVTQPFVRGIQKALRIKQVIAVPFFIGEEMVGNLFAAKQTPITDTDIRVLSAFGRQAAAAIQSARQALQLEVAHDLIYIIQANLENEALILQRIVEGVVSELGYIGALIMTHEQDGSLPIRASHIDPQVASQQQITDWKQAAADQSGKPDLFADPGTLVVYRQQVEYANNLGIRAAETGNPVTSEALFDLLTPIAPDSLKPLIAEAQDALGIQNLIAVPFFIGDSLFGVLFAATRSRRFSSGEVELLYAFGQQAAVGIRNARLYRVSETRRVASQIFAKMAFGSAASIHTLRNRAASVQAQLQMLPLLGQLPEDARQEVLESVPTVLDRLADITRILDHLHEPWNLTQDEPTNVNDCLRYAIDKVFIDPDAVTFTKPDGQTQDMILHRNLTDTLPEIMTTSDMIIETFKVIIKNGFEAIKESDTEAPEMWIESSLVGDMIEVIVRDNGTGIKPENLNRIFEMKWSTKSHGMGFGLYWAKDYVEGLGGSIDVASVWGQGTIFYIRIPVTTG